MAAEPSESLVPTEDELPPRQPKLVRRGWRRVVHRLGQLFILAGVLVLLFVAYELWGTNLWTKRAQNRLRNEFRDKVAAAPATGATSGSGPAQVTPLPAKDAVLLPATGGALAHLVIAKVGVDVIVVEGVDPEALRNGPGHYPGTPLPGEDGNVVLSGHRTTYGAPFHNLDSLVPGDTVMVESAHGSFTYRVMWIRVVAPSDVEVTVTTPGRHELTLTTCHPKFSASERLIVRAEQVGGPRPIR
jgi:sortase A